MARFRPHRMYPGALLAQEACSYQGATELLMGLTGRLAVIIHGDRDCSNVLPKTAARRHEDIARRFLCTNLTEHELVNGLGGVKLRRAIELVHEQWRPALIVVLSTCPTVMMGDNVRQIAARAAQELGARVVAAATHGLHPVSPAEVVDTVYTLLAGASQRTNRAAATGMALVGIELSAAERREIERSLQCLGLELRTVLNTSAALDDFLRVADARFLVHPGPNMLLGFAAMAVGQWGQIDIEVPLPYGVGGSDRFWQAIGRGAGLADAVLPRLAADREPALAELAAARERMARRLARPLRVAYNIGSTRGFDLRRIALEELGELPLFHDLGAELTLFIQGPQDEANRMRTAKVLLDLGCDLPFAIFPAPTSLSRLIRPGEFDLFFGADFLQDQTSQLNLPLVPRRAELGYRGVAANLALIETALDSRFYATFRPHVAAGQDEDAVLAVARPRAIVGAGE